MREIMGELSILFRIFLLLLFRVSIFFLLLFLFATFFFEFQESNFEVEKNANGKKLTDERVQLLINFEFWKLLLKVNSTLNPNRKWVVRISE